MRTRSLAALTFAVAVAAAATPLAAQKDLNDLEMTHVAVTASNIDVEYAKLALSVSKDTAVRAFAETMIRDHNAVNAQVAALAKRLNVTAQDNAMSRQLLADAAKKRDELRLLTGAAFDRAYIQNEVAYHHTVNGVVADAFIPHVENADVKKAFEGALAIFRGHEKHAEQLAAKKVGSGQ